MAIIEETEERLQRREQRKFPASALRAIPRPTIQEIGAGIQSIPAFFPVGMTPGEKFDESMAFFNDDEARRRAEHPFATGAGDLAGDALTLVTGRLPLAGRINQFERALMAKNADLLFGSAQRVRSLEPGVKRVLDRALTSNSMRLLARGAGRTLETGFEAAALDILNGDDPLETAGFAAGAQAGGSVLLTLTKGLTSGSPLTKVGKLSAAALAAGGFIQLVKTTTPGGEDSLIDSLETGYEKVAIGIALGILSGLAGTGRLRGTKLADDLPKLTDALATLPRGAMISMLENFADAHPAQQQRAETVLNQLAQEPGFFGPATVSRLQASIENGTFMQELERLTGDKQFNEKLFSLAPPSFSNGQ